MAFRYMTDLGVAGPDKGKGGKYPGAAAGLQGRGAERLFRGAVEDQRRVGVHARLSRQELPLEQGDPGGFRQHPQQLKVYPLSRKDSRPRWSSSTSRARR
jgi:hypothetical protein